MLNIKKKLLFSLFFFLFSLKLFSQCAMCRAVLESEENKNTAKGINDGIIFLGSIPYILAAIIGLAIYFKFKKLKK